MPQVKHSKSSQSDSALNTVNLKKVQLEAFFDAEFLFMDGTEKEMIKIRYRTCVRHAKRETSNFSCL